MARQGISTGTTPNDGTGDTLLEGATKINSNFSEVYGILGDGTNAFVGIVTQIVAGDNIGVSTAYGSVTVTGTGSTAEVRANTLVVTGVSTLGVVTSVTSIQATKYYGDGSELTGVTGTASTAEVRANTLVVSGVSTFTGNIDANGDLDVDGHTNLDNVNIAGVVTATSFVGSGVNLTGITTLISAGSNITVTTNSGITTIASTATGSGSTAEVRANTLVVTGVTTFSGDVELGSNSFDDITINGDISSSITPDADGTRFLGANGKAFANFYSGAADIGRGFNSGIGITVSNDVYIGGDLEVGFAGSMRGNGSYVTDQRWTVTGANPNYVFSGIGITSGNKNNPYLYFQRGGVYEIDNTTPDSHPFEIRESDGGPAWIAGVSTYRSSANSVTTRIEVPLNAPNILVYQCTVHSGMYSTISVYPNALT